MAFITITYHANRFPHKSQSAQDTLVFRPAIYLLSFLDYVQLHRDVNPLLKFETGHLDPADQRRTMYSIPKKNTKQISW